MIRQQIVHQQIVDQQIVHQLMVHQLMVLDHEGEIEVGLMKRILAQIEVVLMQSILIYLCIITLSVHSFLCTFYTWNSNVIVHDNCHQSNFYIPRIVCN